MAQYQLKPGTGGPAYARQAREARFSGLFCVRSATRWTPCAGWPCWRATGTRPAPSTFQGLMTPAGPGLLAWGVNERPGRLLPAGRDERFASFLTEGRTFGPHGEDLVVANSIQHYDDALSRELTEKTVHANLELRALGFKPYVAPGPQQRRPVPCCFCCRGRGTARRCIWAGSSWAARTAWPPPGWRSSNCPCRRNCSTAIRDTGGETPRHPPGVIFLSGGVQMSITVVLPGNSASAALGRQLEEAHGGDPPCFHRRCGKSALPPPSVRRGPGRGRRQPGGLPHPLPPAPLPRPAGGLYRRPGGDGPGGVLHQGCGPGPWPWRPISPAAPSLARPLVEATGSLQNFRTQADLSGTDEAAAYAAALRDLAQRLAGHHPLPPVRRIAALHASSRATSNTLALWDLVRRNLPEDVEIREFGLRNGTGGGLHRGAVTPPASTTGNTAAAFTAAS